MVNDDNHRVEDKEPNLVVGLDIGTSKILAVLAEVYDKKVVVKGLSSQKTYGVSAGAISDIEQVSVAIKNAIRALEKQTQCEVLSLSVSVSGKHIDCDESAGMVPINRKEVTYKDRDEVLNSARDLAIPQGNEIIHVVPQEYEIDKQQGITNPVGMTGIRLDVKALVVTASSNALNNTRKCIQKCDFNVDNFVFQGIASSLAVLTEDEKRRGVCLVDIGCGTVDLAVYINGSLKDILSIPFAGDHVTMDVARGLHLGTDIAEAFKVKFGSCRADMIPHGEMAELPIHQSVKRISRAELSSIIEARYEDFFGLIRQELKRNYYDHMLGAGLVFTGGGALVEHLEEAATDYFNLPVRVGFVKNVELSSEVVDQHIDIRDPRYANVIGLLRTQQEYYVHTQQREAEEPKESFFQKFKKGLKQYF